MKTKKLFTFKEWRNSLVKLSNEVYILDFFTYIDCLQYFQDNNILYIYAYNSYMLRVVKKYYFKRLSTIIKEVTQYNYTIILRRGLITLDWDKRIIVYPNEITQIQTEEINDKLKLNLYNKEIRIIYICTNKIDRLQILNNIAKLNLNFFITNMRELLQSTLYHIAKLHETYDIFILLEEKHTHEFQKILIEDNNIDKIHLIMLEKKIIILTEIELIVLKDRFIRVIKRCKYR
ncbi:MAG: hypothetical protein KDH96_06450 [Candidatus Riesia sp.]|nr:hypothetical protein [Candidatus Riesia sp.]